MRGSTTPGSLCAIYILMPQDHPEQKACALYTFSCAKTTRSRKHVRYTHSHAPRPPGAESVCAIHILMPQDHPEQKACELYTFSCLKTTRSRKRVRYTHSRAPRPPGAEGVCVYCECAATGCLSTLHCRKQASAYQEGTPICTYLHELFL